METINGPENLTEEEKEKPYASYMSRAPARVPTNILQAIQAGPMDPKDVLPFEKINDMLTPGYHAVETGHCRLPDNSGYVAVLTTMPGVTGEMLDWWFWWHAAAEDLRYKIWYPGSHLGIRITNQDQLLNPKLSARERYWHNPHYAKEDVGIGVDTMRITFMPPAEFGFDASRFEQANVATIISTRVGSESKHAEHTDMCHFVRKTSDGVEMRSRFWIGRKIRFNLLREDSFINRHIVDTNLIRKLAIPSDAPYQTAMHCAQEYNNLKEFLPELYREYGKE
jgi:phloretin hydrolase